MSHSACHAHYYSVAAGGWLLLECFNSRNNFDILTSHEKEQEHYEWSTWQPPQENLSSKETLGKPLPQDKTFFCRKFWQKKMGVQ